MILKFGNWEIATTLPGGVKEQDVSVKIFIIGGSPGFLATDCTDRVVKIFFIRSYEFLPSEIYCRKKWQIKKATNAHSVSSTRTVSMLVR
jgi:hypothetical protein